MSVWLTPEEVSRDPWGAAYRADSVRITSHPSFRRLVREVAIDEQGSHPRYSWISRNSITYGSWMKRGMPRVLPSERGGISRGRGYRLATLMAEELRVLPLSPRGEAVARVYGEAATQVRLRLKG